MRFEARALSAFLPHTGRLGKLPTELDPPLLEAQKRIGAGQAASEANRALADEERAELEMDIDQRLAEKKHGL